MKPNKKELYRARADLMSFDSARQSKIEAKRPNEEDHSQKKKVDEEDRFGKVAASQNSSNLPARGRGIAVFDLDGTLVRGNSSFKFCFYLTKQGVLPRFALIYAFWNYLCFHYGKRTLEELHEKIFEKLLKGLKISLLEKHVSPFIEQLLSKSAYLPAIERLKSAQRLGHYTLILSNSPSFIVKVIAKVFQVDAWISTEYAVDHEQKLCHISSILQGKDKATYVVSIASDLGIPLSAVSSHTDSYLDLPLLEISGKPFGVNPDRLLKRICKRFNWTIL